MDNLEFMKQLPDDSIDLIYCDILYNTGKKFKDYDDKLGTPLEAMKWYKPRLIEMYRILKNTGSIYLQCDWHLNSYIRVELDNIFGYKNFRNEIIWHYGTYVGQTKKNFPRKHDTILIYSKTNNVVFHPQRDGNPENDANFKRWKNYFNSNNEITGAKYPANDSKFLGYVKRFIKKNGHEPNNDDVLLQVNGKLIDSVWNIQSVNPMSKERIDYDTQKPLELMERIIKASSNEGDIVADVFCGSGITGVVAKKLNRKYILCDNNPKACEISKERINYKTK